MQDQLNNEIQKLKVLRDLLEAQNKKTELDPHGLALIMSDIVDNLESVYESIEEKRL